MRFLGSCEVCKKAIHTYRGLGQHLRFNTDDEHRALKTRWHGWRATYRATPRCRKCGELWEIQDPNLKHSKRCPRCEGLRQSMSRRRYESLSFDKPSDPRQLMTASNSKAQWDGLATRSLDWRRGGDLYMRVSLAYKGGQPVGETLREQAVSYKVYRSIVEDAVGAGTYKKQARQRKKARSVANIRKAHAKWAAMTPEHKAAEIARRFRKGSLLERKLASQLRKSGICGFQMNQWQSFLFDEKWCPREADIKIPVGDGRKLVVLCDGEAFHGPKFAFGDAAARIADDVATADAYFAAGYSVVRYSESEVNSGDACRHLLAWLPRCSKGVQLYRTWHPPVEKAV